MFIIQSSLARRIKEYLEESGIESKVFDSFVILEEPFMDEIIERYIDRIFYVERESNNLNFLKELDKDKIYRIVVHPKDLEKEIVEKMEKMRYHLNPKEFTHVLFVFFNGEKYWYSIRSKEFFFRKKERKVISRAYYKIMEAVKRFNIKVKKSWKVLDLGSAPGGWVQFLSEKAGLIVCVDPAELLIEKENIIHIKKKIEDAYEDIEKFAPFDMITCDINDDPRRVAKILIRLSKFLKKEGILIMTIKLIRKDRKLVDETIEILRNAYKDFEIKWLLANSKRERTLFAKKKSKYYKLSTLGKMFPE